jgi:hypothetical protein
MSKDEHYLSKEEAEEMLQIYLGPNIWVAGNFVYLNRNRAKPLDLKAIQQSGQICTEDLRRYLGVKQLGQGYNLDRHIGQLSDYAWLKGKHPIGAGYSPIFDGISKVQKKYPDEKERLESISRRLAYLSFLRHEIEYMNKKYDYEEIPIIFEFYTNKVEVFTTLLVDLLMVLAGLWCDRPGSKIKPGPKPYHFEDLFDCFFPLQHGGYQFFKSINIMLELSAAISVRHNYVHDIGPTISLTNDGGVIEFDIPVKQRYGDFERYMQIELYNSLKKLPPAPGKIIVKDPRFPEFEFEIRRARKGQFDYEGSGVRYKAKVSQYVKMLDSVLWMISRATITAILE